MLIREGCEDYQVAVQGSRRTSVSCCNRSAHLNLQVLSGLGQAQGVEAAVAGQAAVQPGGAGGVGQPQRIACGTVQGRRSSARRNGQTQPLRTLLLILGLLIV